MKRCNRHSIGRVPGAIFFTSSGVWNKCGVVPFFSDMNIPRHGRACYSVDKTKYPNPFQRGGLFTFLYRKG